MKQRYPDKEWLRERVVEEIFYKPANLLLPMFVGLPLAIGPWMFGQANALITFSGVVISLLSLGAYATTAALRWGNEEEVRRKILQRAAREADEHVRRKLEALREKLVRDGDSRSEVLFDQLIALQEKLKTQAVNGLLLGVDEAEIVARTEELVEASLNQLEESANLMVQAAEAVSASVRGHLLERREELLEETRQSIEALDRIFLAFLDDQKDEQKSGTARLRQELEDQLEISARVRRQIEAWEDPPVTLPPHEDPNPENHQ